MNFDWLVLHQSVIIEQINLRGDIFSFQNLKGKERHREEVNFLES